MPYKIMGKDEEAPSAFKMQMKVRFGETEVVQEHDEGEGEDGRLGLADESQTQKSIRQFRLGGKKSRLSNLRSHRNHA